MTLETTILHFSLTLSNALRRMQPFRLPDGRSVTKVHLLPAGSDVTYHEERDIIVVEVPTIDVHEIVALDLAV